MSVRRSFALPIGSLFFIALVAACGGKTAQDTGQGAGAGDSGTTTGVKVATGGNGCVDIEVSAAATSCSADADCTLVRTGQTCSGSCDCGDTPVNGAAAASIEAATADLSLEGCPCAFPGEPRCLGGQCTLCGLGPDQPAGCSDAGVTTTDAGVTTTDDGGVVVDGGACVNIVVTAADIACSSDDDCTETSTGEVCAGECPCGDTPVNQTAQAKFLALDDAVGVATCECVASTLSWPKCVHGQCVASHGDAGTTDGGELGSGSGTGSGSGQGTECADLKACCATLPATQATQCSPVLSANNQASCASFLAEIEAAGECAGWGTADAGA
jgi:hypothetical protein